jgi:TRAP-type C4-dicarboxylate transport system permease large subunit
VWPTCSVAAFVGTDLTKNIQFLKRQYGRIERQWPREMCSVVGLLLMRVICCGVETPQTRAVAHIVYEVFVNMAVVRKIDVSNKYNSLKERVWE